MKRVTRNAIALTALTAIAIAALAGCGDDKKTNSTDGLFRSGTWSLASTVSAGGPGDCPTAPQTFTLQMPLCEDEDPTGQISGDCDGDYSGNTVAFDCTETDTDGPCLVTTRTTGSGTFTETTFNITAQLVETGSVGADCVADPCTTTVQIAGTWLNATGACKGGVVGLSQVLNRSVRKAGIRH